MNVGQMLLGGASTTVVGLIIVFLILGILAFVISLFKFSGGKAKPPADRRAGNPIAGEAPADQSGLWEKDISQPVENIMDDALIAVITAVIEAARGPEAGAFRVFSVKKAGNGWRR
ncbi:MAG: OadG family protein [Firmicutes bacterium]|nr:OadG family protein [Bacillota bacterium]